VIPTVGRAALAAVVTAVLAPNQIDAADEFRLAEVVVVADRTRAAVNREVASGNPRADDRVRVVDGPGRGPAWARQQGLDEAHGDIVLFLDDDVVPRPGLLGGHCHAHVGSDRVVVGYMPVAAECRARSVTATIYSNDYEAECDRFFTDSTTVLRGLWGGNVSLRRTDAMRVPQAVESHRFRSREDEEFGFRCLRAGLTGVFDRSLAAEHWFDRPVSGFLRSAGDQARAGNYLATRYPDLFVEADAGGVSMPERAVRTFARIPSVGRGLRVATERSARRFGDGVPTRARIRLVVLARLLVQIEAVRGD
jgi:glycosyltransferase involved in cell wall biosynthesis